jgi:hypothetical protein
MIYNKNIFLLLCVSVLIFNCGIYSFSGSSIPKDAQSVYIFEIQNNSPLSSPELPRLITENLNNYILSETNLKLSEKNPDLSFSGKISKYNISPISINSQESASQNRLSIEVEIEYINSLDTLNSFSKKFSNYVDFISTENFVDIESDLNNELIKKLIEDIFNASFSNW